MSLVWKAGLAGTAIVAATVYAVAQMPPPGPAVCRVRAYPAR
jgi:hypothetical protein